MKTLRNKFWALLLIVSVAFLSCKKQDPPSPVMPNFTETEVTSTSNPTFTRGQWKVDLFQESNTDETANYLGYLFMFKEDGNVLATKNNDSIIGTWSSIKGSDHMKFRISFPSSPLSELNDDWDIKNETYTNLKLEHISGGNNETDHLTFGRYFAH
ncbi:MAG: hypothetical protein V4565_03165 [Bacteroidota bacterium]